MILSGDAIDYHPDVEVEGLPSPSSHLLFREVCSAFCTTLLNGFYLSLDSFPEALTAHRNVAGSLPPETAHLRGKAEPRPYQDEVELKSGAIDARRLLTRRRLHEGQRVLPSGRTPCGEV